MSHDKGVIRRILYVIIMRFERITRWRCLSVALTVLALVMPARAFIFDSFGDGFWTVINNGNGNTLMVNADQSGSATITLVMNNGQPTANTATNSFLVTVLTTLAGSWRQQFFGSTANAGSAADNADPDGDGIANVMERFFGLNPLVTDSSSAVPAVAMLDTNLVITYTHSLMATDLTWQVQWSPDLSGWWANGVTDIGVSTNGNTEVRQGTIPASTSSPLFMRVQVSVP